MPHAPRQERLERLEQATLQLSRHSARVDAAQACGLSPVQYLCLRHVSAQPRLVSDVARFLGISNAGTTGLVDRLLEQELVDRRRDEADRRLVWVSIAPKGLAAMEQMRAARWKRLEAMFAPLSDDELETIAALVAKLRVPE